MPAQVANARADAGAGGASVAGQEYLVTVRPIVKTRYSLAVARLGAPFGYADGAEAKREVSAYCANLGRRLAPGVLGRFADENWIFDGGCA